MDKTEENLKRIRALDTKGYPDDLNPENWKTINGSHVHLDENGNYDGGAGGKFNKSHHWGPGWKQKNQGVSSILNVLGNLGKQKQAQQPKQPPPQAQPPAPAGNKPQSLLNNLAKATAPAIALNPQSQIGKALMGHNAKHEAAINKLLQAAPQNYAEAFTLCQHGLKLISLDYKKGAHYDVLAKGVNINLEKSNKIDGLKPYQTLFHELGHNLDAYAHRPSCNYKNGIFGQTIMEEVKEKIKAKQAELKAKKPGQKVPVAEAYAAVSKELYALPEDCRSALSDIFGGATKGKATDGWGHKVSYWKDQQKLPREAFAEFCESMATNPEQYKIMQQWLPKSTQIMNEMLDSIVAFKKGAKKT